MIVGLITLLTSIPVLVIVIDSIHNRHIQFAWDNSYIKNDESYVVKALIQSEDPLEMFVLKTDEKETSKLLMIATEDGQVIWEKAYADLYLSYKVWSDHTIVLTKAGNKGFSVINLSTGKKVYDYNIDETVDQEFLNLELNDRSVLMTDNTLQTLYDRDYKEVILDTLGNNFYALLPGNQCAFLKNKTVFLYQNDRLERIEGSYDLTQAEFLYYDEGGLLVFNQKDIQKYSYNLAELHPITYLKLFEHNHLMEGSYYKKVNNLVTFYMYDGMQQSAYMFDTTEFTYKVLPLEQRIKGLKDSQNMVVCDDAGHYLLYDDYQVTLFNHENLIARQWYELPLNQKQKNSKEIMIAGTPIYSEGKLIWIERNGNAHAVTIQ